MELDLQDNFKFLVPGAKYDRRVKAGKWDGYKNLYNRRTRRMYTGLLLRVLVLCEQKGWSTQLDPDLMTGSDVLEDEDLDQLLQLIEPHDEGLPIEMYDYQREGVKYMISMDRSTSLAATSAGKSLMLYVAVRIYQLLEEMNDKTIFIVVPSVSLVEQLYNDFDNYSSFKGSNWSVGSQVQKIAGKYSKQVNHPIVITTWQSMDKLPYHIYEDMGALFVDETHTASANVLTSIVERCINTPFRHGVTGTLDGSECNEMVIEGLLGPIKRIVDARTIIDQGRASDLHIHMTMLSHPHHIRQEVEREKSKLPPKQRYHKEVEIVEQLQYRRDFILDLVSSIPGNSLALFDHVEGYGRELYAAYKEDHPNTFLIIGEVESAVREEIRQTMEQYDDATIFASFKTMQQGVSIKKLQNLFLVSSSKSIIRILQSIGRMMRMHHTKEFARVFDIVDDLSLDGESNYMMQHAQERVEIFHKEKYKIDFDQYNLDKYIEPEGIDQYL
jgi:superfamily II DNA or RNA helicase